MDKIIISVLGVSLIGTIYWFFFGKKEEAVETSESLTIVVDGGYKPNIIKMSGNHLIILFNREFTVRKDKHYDLRNINIFLNLL